MARLSDFRGGEYIKVADLGSKEHLVQIESIDVKEIGEDKKEKLVARFEGKSKGLVLNDTNLEVLELGFGSNTNDAIGGQVILYVDPNVRFGGQRVGGVRIKLPKSAAQKETTAPKKSTAEILNDDIPFGPETRG